MLQLEALTLLWVTVLLQVTLSGLHLEGGQRVSRSLRDYFLSVAERSAEVRPAVHKHFGSNVLGGVEE